MRRMISIAGTVLLLLVWTAGAVHAAAPDARATEAVRNWYRLILELVRHTATYSPPVAARSFAYIGTAAYESVAAGSENLVTLTGQLNAMPAMPERQQGVAYDEATVVNATITSVVGELFANTGPTGQRAMRLALLTETPALRHGPGP